MRAIAGDRRVGREGRGTAFPTSSASMLGETRSSSVSPNPQCTTDMSKKHTRLRTGATFQLSTTAPIMPRYIWARRRAQVRCDHGEGIGPRDAMARNKWPSPLPSPANSTAPSSYQHKDKEPAAGKGTAEDRSCPEVTCRAVRHAEEGQNCHPHTTRGRNARIAARQTAGETNGKSGHFRRRRQGC